MILIKEYQIQDKKGIDVPKKLNYVIYLLINKKDKSMLEHTNNCIKIINKMLFKLKFKH